MGIDIIKNLTYSKKKRKIKFDLADNNITPLTFYSYSDDDKYKVPFEELEYNTAYYIIFQQYHTTGLSENSIKINYAFYKSCEMLEKFAKENRQENMKGTSYDFYNLMHDDGPLKEEAEKYFKEVVVPYFWERFSEKIEDGKWVVKAEEKYIKTLSLNKDGYPSSYKYSLFPQHIGIRSAMFMQKLGTVCLWQKNKIKKGLF